MIDLKQQYVIKQLTEKFPLQKLTDYCYYYAANPEQAKYSKTVFDMKIHQTFCLCVILGGKKIKIFTKNRYDKEYNYEFNVDDVYGMSKAIFEQLTQFKRNKIKQKLCEIEKDFSPYEEYDTFNLFDKAL